MDHMDDNPHAHAVDQDHISNPLIIIHVTCMITAYVILMPLGIMLGIRRHKFHVPVNALMFLIAMVGYFFGYGHHMFGIGEGAHDHDNEEGEGTNTGDMPGMNDISKRQTGDVSAEHYGWTWHISAHGALGNLLLILLFVQVGMGVYRKLTKAKPRLRLAWLSGQVPRKVHSYLGKAHLILAYIQVILGFIKLLNACPGQFFGQCISHITMGGSFWWYGGIYIAYLVGSFPGVSRPEKIESLIMTVWGVINFTVLHQWGTSWSHADLQHTSLGLLWVAGGLLSLLLESKYSPLAQFMIRKNPLPAILVVLTGYAMGQHAQYYMFATVVHTFFGYALMLGGVFRLIQLALRPSVSPLSEDGGIDEDDDAQDKTKIRHGGPGNDSIPGLANGETPVSAFFGFLSALGIISAGLLFQSAHEEQLNITMYYLTDPSTYINWIMSLAFFSILFMMVLAQVGKKTPSGSNGVSAKAYNRVRTTVDSEDREQALSRNDIEMSGFME
ncbi:hypothetical protein BGZ96_008442 [Linnemannia gamsii]|uniref:Integral membrane protein n=1 Tax=Linnemannia gamsii TaxID=64522 RepID=A0ABQ7JYS4_9FUNG|nr:hypothetical protein BGZ96_008442 [Linnemannia gamsii]